MFYIYIVQNLINKKIYVGKTNDPKARWRNHLSCARGGKEKYSQKYQYLHKSIIKYNETNFLFQVIEGFETETESFDAEMFWIEFFRSWDHNYGYNLTRGGEGTSGKIVSRETKNKIRIKATGRRHSKETKIKISNAGRLRINSIETRNKISKSNKGRKLTKKQRLANSERQLGKVLPLSQIENMKKSAKNGESSPVAKINNSQALEIRKLHAEGMMIKDIAKIYNVGSTCISYIVNRKTFKHI